jgi:hypothetical protein
VGRSIVLLAIGASLLLSGCARTSQSDIDKAKAQGAAEEAAKQKQASVEADVQKLKEDLAKAQASASASSAATQKAAPQTAAPPAPAPAAKVTSCGGNLSVGANTSCSFAVNVEAAFYAAGGGTSTIEVYSPVTAKYYTMRCMAGIPSVCRGGNNAVVYIR